MAQHFLLSAAARTLSLKTIYSQGVNERSKLTQFQRLILTRRSEVKVPRRTAHI
jgi:hypothetical protein